MAIQKHPPMDLANMRRQGDHQTASANFLAAYEAGDENALWQAVVYCSGARIPLWEWLANELLMPWRGRPAMPSGED